MRLSYALPNLISIIILGDGPDYSTSLYVILTIAYEPHRKEASEYFKEDNSIYVWCLIECGRSDWQKYK
jgi:hypothetical protein